MTSRLRFTRKNWRGHFFVGRKVEMRGLGNQTALQFVLGSIASIPEHDENA